MKLAIVDDNEQELEILISYIKKQLDNIEIYRYRNGSEFLVVWEKDKFDIVVLDIFIGDKNGMDIARIIRQTDDDVRIVFVSASGEFAGESYEVSASYYLRKPYGEDQIKLMLERLDLEKYKSALLTLPDGREIKFKNIMYMDGVAGTAGIHLRDGSVITVKAMFAALKKQLSERFGFYNLTDNMIINFGCVTTHKGNKILMSNGSEITAAKRRAKESADAFTAYCFEKLRKGGGDT